LRSIADRARAALAASSDERAPGLSDALERYGKVAERLASLPRTFIHGEFYPSNVLVETTAGAPIMRPVDWEMAAVGPGLIDLAALAGGWEDDERDRLLAAYREGLGEGGCDPGPEPGLAADLDRCRLHLALQWIGWSREWRPPPEHRQDWVGEAEALMTELVPA
jgi:thiamine kinase-like enzyme